MNPQIVHRLPSLTNPTEVSRQQLREQYESLKQQPSEPGLLVQVKENLLETALDPLSTPRELIEVIEQIPALRFLLDQDARILEGYSIREHTSMVLDQFKNYLSECKLNLPISNVAILIALLFHDLGKSLPDEKSEQHIYNNSVIGSFRDILPLSDHELRVVSSIIQNDSIGKFVISCVDQFASVEQRTNMREQSLVELISTSDLSQFQKIVKVKTIDEDIIQRSKSVIDEINGRAETLGISGQELFNLHIMFYQADTSAYTYDSVDINGRRAYPGLDFLYKLDLTCEVSNGEKILTKNQKDGILEFSDDIEPVVSLLRKFVH